MLKNGVVLCQMMNKISPGAIPKFKQSGPAFLLMENVQSFLAAIKKYGVPDEEVFQTPDLFEARNIPQVTLCIYALAQCPLASIQEQHSCPCPCSTSGVCSSNVNCILRLNLFSSAVGACWQPCANVAVALKNDLTSILVGLRSRSSWLKHHKNTHS